MFLKNCFSMLTTAAHWVCQGSMSSWDPCCNSKVQIPGQVSWEGWFFLFIGVGRHSEKVYPWFLAEKWKRAQTCSSLQERVYPAVQRWSHRFGFTLGCTGSWLSIWILLIRSKGILWVMLGVGLGSLPGNKSALVAWLLLSSGLSIISDSSQGKL